MPSTDLAERLKDLPPEKLKLFAQLLADRAKARHAGLRVDASHANTSLDWSGMHEAATTMGASRPQLAPLDAEALQSFRSSADRTKAGTRKFYNAINRQLSSTIFGEHSAFLNYGYVADDSPAFSPITVPGDMVNKTSVKLVLELVADCDLTGTRVLDVGCGRGGTLVVLNRLFDPALKLGLDLSSDAISFCRKTHHYPDTYFLEGDSERLPFGDDCCDVVINIESSHSYPSIANFYAEVRRVLRAGGCFLYTDVFAPALFNAHVDTILGLGFKLESERNITRNVLLSCRDTAAQRAHAFGEVSEPNVIHDFLSTPDSSVFAEMESGRAMYRMFRLRRSD